MQHFLLEQALNYFIHNNKVDLSALNDKTLFFTLEDLPLSFNFICTNDRIFVTTQEDLSADVDVKLRTPIFLALLQGDSLTDLLRQDKIKIHGDVKTVQLLVDLLQKIDIDLEEMLAKHTGDIVAHQLGKFAKNLKKSKNPIDSIKDELTTLLITPSASSLFKNKRF